MSRPHSYCMRCRVQSNIASDDIRHHFCPGCVYLVDEGKAWSRSTQYLGREWGYAGAHPIRIYKIMSETNKHNN